MKRFFILCILIFLLSHQAYASPDTVTVTRTLPENGTVGRPVNVTLNVSINKSYYINAIGIQEQIPEGWILLSAEPSHVKYENHTITWLFGPSVPEYSFSPLNDTVIKFSLRANNPNNTFSGRWFTSSENGTVIGNTYIENLIDINIRRILLEIERWVRGEIDAVYLLGLINEWRLAL